MPISNAKANSTNMSPETLNLLTEQARRIRDIAGDVTAAIERERDRPATSAASVRLSFEAVRVQLEKRNVVLEEQLKQLSKELAAYKEDNAKLTDQLHEARGAVINGTAALTKVNEEREVVLRLLAAANTDNRKLSQRLCELRADRRRLFDTADANEKRLRKLMAEVKAAIE